MKSETRGLRKKIRSVSAECSFIKFAGLSKERRITGWFAHRAEPNSIYFPSSTWKFYKAEQKWIVRKKKIDVI